MGGLSGEESSDGTALAALIAAVEQLSASSSAEDVGRIVRVAARQLTGADGVAVVLRDGDKVHYIDEDAVGPLWKGGIFPIGDCISGWAILNRQTVVIEDVFADPRIPHAFYAPTFVKSLVMAPVRPSDPIAAIGAYWATTRRPSGREVAAVELVARTAAVALETVRLRASLEKALFEAEAASRAKSDFLANISHEVRTPLNGLVGSAELLSKSLLTHGQAELIEVMKASGADLERVLTDVLAFARMDGEAGAVDAKPFYLGETVREVGRLFETRFLAKGVAFDVAVAQEAEGLVEGDRLRLKQVLNSLVGNALKFTAEGRVTLSVAPHGEDGRWRLSVADTGVGFAAQDKDRIFARFEQADRSSTRVFGGAGLGLCIARSLTDSMGGTLDAEGRPGEGATFTLDLPLALAEDVRAPSVLVAEPEAQGERRIRVLVVDDHPVNRKVAELMLSQVGAEICHAVNGEEACQAFKADRFDVVLMDIQMPVMDGITATRAIRQIEAQRDQGRTPILMLTANTLPEHVEASRDAGADRHLAKPIQLDTLFDALNETLAA